MTHNVQSAHVDGIPLAVVRRQAKASELSTVVPACCGLVWNALREKHVAAGRHVAVYWDGSIRLEVGVELKGDLTEGDGEVVHSSTPAGTAAFVTHLGPYGALGKAHGAIRDWCESHGYQMLGPNWEIYGHWKEEWNADPSQIRTDVFYLIER